MRLGDSAIGDVVYLKVSGDATAFRVMHHGKPDDTYDNSFLNGTILMLDHSEEPYLTRMVEEVDERTPRQIADEIVALNEESKQLLDEILGML